MTDTPRLITFTVSHYCEKARWALDYCNISYVEECYVPGAQKGAIKHVGGTTLPVLLISKTGIIDSTPIVAWADEHAQEPSPAVTSKLIPLEEPQRAAVLELCELFGKELGVAARTLFAHHLAEEPQIFLRDITEGPVGCVACLFRCCLPVLSCFVGSKMRANEQKLSEATATLDRIYDMVGSKVEDRKYLVGDSFSAADLCFASLSTPILFPDELSLMKRQFENGKFPNALKEVVNKYRNTPAGQYALRLYREDRFRQIKRT